MTFYILAVLILFIVQTFSSALTHYGPLGVDSITDALGPRDNPSDRTVISSRLDRARANMMEALPVFLPLALLHEMRGDVPEAALTGAMVFLIARVVFMFAYASGIMGLRTLVWLVGHGGLLMMALAL